MTGSESDSDQLKKQSFDGIKICSLYLNKNLKKVCLVYSLLICDCYWLSGLTTGRGFWPAVLQWEPSHTSAHLSQDISHLTLVITSQSGTLSHSSILDSALTRCKWSHGVFLFSLLWAGVNHNLWSEETLNETNSFHWISFFFLFSVRKMFPSNGNDKQW